MYVILAYVCDISALVPDIILSLLSALILEIYMQQL